jgi:hypothetical protein
MGVGLGLSQSNLHGGNAVNSFLSALGNRVTGILHGFDRLRFIGTQRMLANAGGMQAFLAGARVRLKDFGQWSEQLSVRIRQACEAVMVEAGRPNLYLNSSSISKEQLAESIRLRDRIKSGPVCQLRAVEVIWSYEIHRDRARKQLVLEPRLRKCLHLYHYWVDEQVGMMHVRIPTWLPFGIKLCINGREWLCRELDKGGIGYERRDNCLVKVSNLTAAQEVLDEQMKTDWPAFLERVVKRSHPAWNEALQLEGRPLDYYWSLEQSEWASDLMFRDSAALKQVYPKLVRHGITQLSCDSVMRFLGRRCNAAFNGQVQSDLRRRQEGVRLKYSVNQNSVKMYDKEGSILRIETTLHNPRDLKVFRGTETDPQKKRWRPMRKGIADLYRRAQVSQASNQRYMEALSQTNLNKTVSETIEPVCKSVIRNGKGRNGKRHRAIRPLHEPDMSLLKAVSDGRWTINGFRNQDIRAILLGTDPTDAGERKKRSGQITRKLALLHAHGLIKKVPRTRRWLITAKGREIAGLLQATQSVPSEKLLAAA